MAHHVTSSNIINMDIRYSDTSNYQGYQISTVLPICSTENANLGLCWTSLVGSSLLHPSATNFVSCDLPQPCLTLYCYLVYFIISFSTISTFASFIHFGSRVTTTMLTSLGSFNFQMTNNTAQSASSVTPWTLHVSTQMSFLIATKAFLYFPRKQPIFIWLVTNCTHLVSQLIIHLVSKQQPTICLKNLDATLWHKTKPCRVGGEEEEMKHWHYKTLVPSKWKLTRNETWNSYHLILKKCVAQFIPLNMCLSNGGKWQSTASYDLAILNESFNIRAPSFSRNFWHNLFE